MNLPHSPRRIVVVADDGTRVQQFARECERLWAVLGAVPCVLDIQHVGSTAVPNLDAKPIIDIAIAVTSFEDAQVCIQPIVALGYNYRGENGIPRRHYFVKNNPADADTTRRRTHHLHIFEKEGAEWKRHLAFRDALRADSALARCYAMLKHELAAQHADNSTEYCNGKTAFIENALAAVLPSFLHNVHVSTMPYSSSELAQLQLDAYNNRDIDQFAAYFAPDVQVFDQSTGECTLRGRDALYERYGAFFAANANVHCQLLNRIAEGRFAIDHERVTGLADGRELYAVAVYETDGEYIAKVWFMRR